MKHVLILWIFFIATILYADTSRHDRFRGDQLNIGNIQVIDNELSSISGAVTITPATSLIINDASIGTSGDVLTSTDTNGTATWSTPVTDHGALTGLSDDDHTQYLLLLGRSGGQIINGGTDANNDLTILSTSNATTGTITLGQSVTILGAAIGNTVGIGVTNPSAELEVKGGGGRIRISGTSGTDYGFEFESLGTRFWQLISDPTDNSMSWISTGAPFMDLLTTGELALGATSETHTTDAKFEVITTTQGSIPCPLMTTAERDAIGTPSEGMCISNTTTNVLNHFNGTVWGSVSASAGATIELDNLGTVAISADLDPGVTNTIDFGNISKHFKRLHVNTIALVKNGVQFGFIDADATVALPSGANANFAFQNITTTAAHNIAFNTVNTTSGTVPTASAFIETGNQNTAVATTLNSGDISSKTGDVTNANNDGDSGSYKVEIGTVAGGGARGTIDFLDGTEGTSGECWVSTGTLGEGNWDTCPGSVVATNPYQIENVGFAAAVGGSDLTIDLKQSDGSTDPASGSGAVQIAFRNATEATGGYLLRSETAAETIVIPSGATLGHTSTGSDEGEIIYIYAIDNAGTIELAVSSVNTWLEDRVHTTVSIGPEADDRDVLYSTTLRSNVAVRLIGKAFATQTTAATWAAVPTRLTPTNSFLNKPFAFFHFETNAGQTFTTSVLAVTDFEDLVYSSHTNAVTTGVSWKFEPPIDGLYQINSCLRFGSLAVTTGVLGITMRINTASAAIHNNSIGAAATSGLCISTELSLVTTDDLDLQGFQSNGVNRSLNVDPASNFITIRLMEAR